MGGDQRRHALGEGEIIDRELERADLDAPETTGVTIHEGPPPTEIPPVRPPSFRYRTRADSTPRAWSTSRTDRSTSCESPPRLRTRSTAPSRAARIDRTVAHTGAISQSPASKARIASRYQSGI